MANMSVYLERASNMLISLCVSTNVWGLMKTNRLSDLARTGGHTDGDRNCVSGTGTACWKVACLLNNCEWHYRVSGSRTPPVFNGK